MSNATTSKPPLQDPWNAHEQLSWDKLSHHHQPTPATMSSYLSNLLGQTTSRYNSIRRTFLKDEEDGDTEDDSHISRVLRAYYTEKGRPFPPWLPPDPNDRKAITPQPHMQQQQTGGGYFNRGGQVAAVQQQASSRPSSLSDLWDSPSQNNAPMQPQSLRNARRPVAQPPPPSSGATLAPRPLPSQRAGSYQSMQSQASGRSDYGNSGQPPPGSGGGGTAQDRLKARLWGGGRSGGNAGGSPTPYDQPAYGSGNPYDAGGGGGGGDRRYGRPG